MAEIQEYLLSGVNHLCHTHYRGKRHKIACRGGRDFQLQCWHRMGILPAPTDSALESSMREFGL